MSLTLRFDLSQQTNPEAIGMNRGCPPGYFAQFVAADQPDATDYGNQWTAVRCRLLPPSVANGNDPGGDPLAVPADVPEVLAESGTTYTETLTYLRQAVAASVPAIGLNLSLLAVAGLGVLWFVFGRGSR